MKQTADLQIGHLTTGSAYRPHYPNFEKLIPPDVNVVFGGLGIVGRTQSHLAGKSDEVVRQALEFSSKFSLHGMIVSGAPLFVFNPGLETKIAQAVGLPVAAPLSSSTAALKALTAKKLVVITPFLEEVNSKLGEHLSTAGFNVMACPLFESSGAKAGGQIPSDELFAWVEQTFTRMPDADAIYFQGSSMDPIPIIQRLEDKFGVSVVASNCAMLWCLLSRLGHKYSIKGYGRLFALWPDCQLEDRHAQKLTRTGQRPGIREGEK